MAHILVVDDTAFQRKSISRLLQHRGHTTALAAHGIEALEQIIADKPDCIVTDLLMPEMDGLTFIRTLRNECYSIPVVVVSADIQETTKSACFELGVKSFLNKPFKPEDLDEAVQEAIEKAA
ncbi:MAG: response regulator [Nitrospirae bacterium]|nr:response regulator [Nitrospirota bacterium]